MADDDLEQSGNPQPVTRVAEWIRDAAREVGNLIRPMMAGPETDVEADRSAQLSPPHSPTHRDAGDGQPDGWVRAKSLADDLPPSVTESILGSSQATWPPPGPEPVQDLGTLGVAPQAGVDFSGLADTLPPSITKALLDNPQAFWPQPEPGPSPDLGTQASIEVSGLADTLPPSITESILSDPGRYYQPPEPGPEPQPDRDKGLDR